MLRNDTISIVTATIRKPYYYGHTRSLAYACQIGNLRKKRQALRHKQPLWRWCIIAIFRHFITMTAIFKADNKSTKAMTNSGFSVDKFRLEEVKAIPLDYKKEYKELYIPKNKPSIVTVPSMNYIEARGHGDPNVEAGEYKHDMFCDY